MPWLLMICEGGVKSEVMFTSQTKVGKSRFVAPDCRRFIDATRCLSQFFVLDVPF
jgi:hypothetical protein